jgi:Rps23 Pro-64 3,4-dihydroxylase Tpa1-like proline 4-hydroxylase
MINHDLNIPEHSESFARDKSVQIFDFLEKEESIKLYDWLNSDMPEDWWFTSIVGAKDGSRNKLEKIQIKPDTKKLRDIKIKEASETFLNGGWSYVFDRTVYHDTKCNCIECQFIKFLRSQDMLEFIKSVTGIDAQKLTHVFSSRYLSNFFLSPHPDSKHGKIGFVYSLSKDWRPEWGGNLHFMDEDYRTVTRTVVPVFNKLTLFDISAKAGVPHYVSHVVPNVKVKRLSITGWFG